MNKYNREREIIRKKSRCEQIDVNLDVDNRMVNKHCIVRIVMGIVLHML